VYGGAFIQRLSMGKRTDLGSAEIAWITSLSSESSFFVTRSAAIKNTITRCVFEVRDQPLSLPLIASEPFGHGDELGKQRHLQHKENNLGHESNDERR
jgi:hypothetical protein